MPAPTQKLPKSPQEVSHAFTLAAITTLQELVQIDAVAEPLAAPAAMDSGELVIARMKLTRDPPGAMSLLMPAETASLLASRYLPPQTPLTQEIIDDAAGEFANVIAGQAKTFLKGTPYHFTISPPTVTSGTRIAPQPEATTANLVIRVTFEEGQLQVIVS